MAEEKNNIFHKFKLSPLKLAIFVIPVILVLSLLAFSTLQSRPSTMDIEVSDLSSNNVSTVSYKGRVQVVEFFATWCDYCKDVTASIASYLRINNQSNVMFWSISIDPAHDQPSKINSYISQENVESLVNSNTWIFARDLSDIHTKYKVSGLPAIFLVDQNLKIINFKEGPISTAELNDWISPLLNF